MKLFAALLGGSLLVSCGGSDSDGPPPAPPTFTIGGSVSGLFGTNLVLQNNGGDPLTVNANGAFAFVTGLEVGGAYNVTVRTQPQGTPAQTCTVSGGTGSVALSNITTVAVSCRAPTGRFLYIPVKNPNAIAGFTVDVTNGALTPLAGSPFAFSATGVPPRLLVTDPAARALYILSDNETAGSGASGLVAWVVDGTTGALSQGGTSTAFTGETQTPALHPGGGFLYASVGPPNRTLQWFPINSTTAVLGSPGSVATPANETPGAPVIRPTSGATLYVPSATSTTPPSGKITVYTINLTTGAAAAMSSPTLLPGNMANELIMHPAGTHLYTRNATAAAFTQRFTILTSGTLADPLTIPTTPGAGAAIASGSRVYFSQQGGTLASPAPGSIAGFVDVSSGAAAALPGSPYLTGGNNAGPATLDPTGRFIAVTNVASGTVAMMRIDSATGALTHVPGSPVFPAVGTQPGRVTFDPSARFLYVTDAAQKSVSSYSVDATTGTLTFSDSEALTGTPERAVTLGLQ